METTDSFGYWVRRRRKALDLTQEELAKQVGCAVVSLRKIEADERRPSPQMAQRLAQHLALPPAELPRFMAAASGEQAPFHLPMSKAPAARLRSNLPAPVTSLVGRSAELVEITDGLREGKTRLLTLTGPVGVGKTRLALEAGRRLAGVFRDGVCLVALSSVQDPSLVPSATATALRVREARDCDLAEAVAGFLADREMLLIFDNFEHLLPAASFLEALLAASPGLRLLVTSRARLRVYGEHEFPVLPFHLPQSDDLLDAASADAVRLFCDRARAARAGFHLTPSLTPTVVDICQRLDGLPLAIELATARLKTLTPVELRDRLAERRDWLAQERAPAIRRQGLHEALTWSYGLLAPAERTLLARLAIFVGGFSQPAADAVCAGWEGQPAEPEESAVSASAAAGVAALLEQSLLVSQNALSAACFSVTRCCGRCSLRTLRESSEAQSRFSMLEIVREFALEHLAASGQMEQVRQRHARYYAAWAEQAAAQLNGPEQASWLLRLEQEADNLRAALTTLLARGPLELELAAAMACALGAFWQRHGHYREGRGWLEQVLAQMEQDATPAVLRARTLQNAAALAYRQSDWQTARQWLDESLTIYRAAGDPAGLARVLYDLGWIAIDQKEWSEAARLNQESLGWAQRAGDPCAIYSALTNLGWAQMCAGAWDAAATLFDQAHQKAQQAGHLKGIAVSQANLGWIALHQGDPARAAALARESLQQCHLLGEREVLAECLEILAATTAAEGNTDRSLELSSAADALWETLHVTRPPTRRATALTDQLRLAGPSAREPGRTAHPRARSLSPDTLVAFALNCGGAP